MKNETKQKQTNDQASTSEEKKIYQKPTIEMIGKMEELTGSTGPDNDDGWGGDVCP